MPAFQFRLPQLQDLTPSQRRAVNEMNPIILTGVPGCGKTVVSIFRLLQSNQTQLFTYTRMLRAGIAQSSMRENREAANRIHSIYAWFGKKCHAKLSDAVNNKTVLTMLNNNRVTFNEIIFDEAQDLYEVILTSFKQVSQKVSVGADIGQQVYDGRVDNENIFINILPTNILYELATNFRNNFEIFNFAKEFVPFSARAHNQQMLERLQRERSGTDKPFVYIRNNQQEINAILKRILETYSNQNIGIFVERQNEVNKYADIINSFSIEHSKYHEGLSEAEKFQAENNLKNILVTTYKSAKGLEFDTVILPEFNFASDTDRNRRMYYVGATRARSNLFLLCLNNLPNIINNNIFDSSTYQIL